MPVTYRIERSLGVVFSTCEGVLTCQEICDHERALLQDPDFDSSFNQLIKLTGVTTFDLSSDEVCKVAKIETLRARRAMVVSEDPLLFGMVRMYQILRDSDPDDIQVFHDIKAARKWLGLE